MRPALHVTLDTLHFQLPDHPPPPVLVRQFAEPGLHVVPHVRRARGRGNDAGDRGVGKNVLEKELRPARAIEFRSVGRELTAAYAGEERAFFERTVDEHTDIVLATERQETLLGLAGRERIVELGEVELFRTQHALEVVVRSDRVVRNPDVAYRTLVFQTAQRAGMRTPVDQIVNLQQVDTRRPQKTHRLLDLRDPLVPTARPDLRGEERLIA